MKKIVPNLMRIETSYKPIASERLLLWRYNRIIDEGFTFPVFDFYHYCALLIRHNKKVKLPQIMKNGDLIKPEIKLHLINCQINNEEYVSDEDFSFYYNVRSQMIKDRKQIIKTEIKKTIVNDKFLKIISSNNSTYYRNLISLTNEFTDITLLDWFIPIVLTYERLIHIFIRHVEETKFGESQSKKRRTFFEYQPDEIWILLKTIIKQEKKEIENHFLINSVNNQLNQKHLMRDFHRNFYNPILFNGDKFTITIDKNGFIKQFYQL